MTRTPIIPDLDIIPAQFHSLLKGPVYDSSSHPDNRVYYLDTNDGLFLKSAPKGMLEREAAMTRFYHEKGLGAQVLAYESLERDWLLTRRIPGEDCTHEMYTADPKRLSAVQGELLRMLHSIDFTGCRVNRTREYIEIAHRNYETGNYSKDHFPDNWGYATAEEAWAVVESGAKYLKSDVLLHGDFCLPNVMLQDWRFTGFIDVDAGGIGDRHVDLFWGIWSLWFNLKTDAWRERFLDAYGREDVEEEMLRLIAALEVFQ